MVDAINAVNTEKIDWYKITYREIKEYEAEGKAEDMPDEVKKWVDDMAASENAPDDITYELANNVVDPQKDIKKAADFYEYFKSKGADSSSITLELIKKDKTIITELKQLDNEANSWLNKSSNTVNTIQSLSDQRMASIDKLLDSKGSDPITAFNNKIEAKTEGKALLTQISVKEMSINDIDENLNDEKDNCTEDIRFGKLTISVGKNDIRLGAAARETGNNTIEAGKNGRDTMSQDLDQNDGYKDQVKDVKTEITEKTGATISIKSKKANKGSNSTASNAQNSTVNNSSTNTTSTNTSNTAKTNNSSDKTAGNNIISNKPEKKSQISNKVKQENGDTTSSEANKYDKSLSDKRINSDSIEIQKRKEKRGEIKTV